MDKALFADSIATSIGAICGTSNTTTYVESSAGIAAGGRTGPDIRGRGGLLRAVRVPVPGHFRSAVRRYRRCAGRGRLHDGILVEGDRVGRHLRGHSGVRPTTSVFMAFSYSISYGIAGGFITYCIIKTCKKQAKDVHIR